MRSLSVALVFALLSPGTGTAAGSETADPLRASVQSLREVGVALWNWYHDEHASAKIALAPDLERVDLAAIPVLPLEDVAALLVPKYLTNLPRTDGWGNPLEIRVYRGERTAGVLAVRSAGADGLLQASCCEVGPFDSSDAAADLVWVDGVFVRWPRSQSESR